MEGEEEIDSLVRVFRTAQTAVELAEQLTLDAQDSMERFRYQLIATDSRTNRTSKITAYTLAYTKYQVTQRVFHAGKEFVHEIEQKITGQTTPNPVVSGDGKTGFAELMHTINIRAGDDKDRWYTLEGDRILKPY